MNPNRILVITGLSGSGKTIVLDSLEDIGYFCIDNMPTALFGKLLELSSQPTGEINRIAMAMDARDRDIAVKLPQLIDEQKEAGIQIELVFLEASPEILERRYSVTRRPHPLAATGLSLAEAIARESEILSPIRKRATHIINTDQFSVHELRRSITERFAGAASDAQKLNVQIMSFGFSHGSPRNADLVIDVRFLPNPYFKEELKNLTGLDPKVAEYILELEPSAEFIDRIISLLVFLLPHYRHEGKAYLTIAFGCTGGRHRSVLVAEKCAAGLGGESFGITVVHRDLPVDQEADCR